MSVTLTNLVTEVQARCNALTNFSLIETVIDCAIAAKKVEMAGGSITRTTLDTQIQRFVTASGGGSVIEDLIALAASVEVRAGNGKKQKVATYLTSGTWTRPDGVDTVEVLLVGGGGGAGGTNSTGMSGSVYLCSGAGGGGQVLKQLVDVTSITVGSTASITIGAGGAGGSNSGAAGGVGGDTSFGSLLTALGGGSGSGYTYSGGSGSGTPRATSGGGSGATPHGSYGVVILPGLGGGAGGSARKGFVIQVNNSNGATYTYTQQSTYGANTVPCGRGTSPVGLSTTSSYYGVTENGECIPGEPLYGYGAGGGAIGSYSATNSLYGAGGGSSVNALANTGGGGAANSVIGDSVGGTGGSGLAIVTWWE